MKQITLSEQDPIQNMLFNGDTSVTAQALQAQLEQMRPTLVVGAGGTGQLILTFLKLILQKRFGDDWQRRIRLLSFDTAEETYAIPNGSGKLIALENAAEFFHIGNVPVAGIKRNIDSQAAIQERLGPIMINLPPVVLRSGAKQLRPFGLLSLLWNYTAVSEQISRALWGLAGRNQLDASALTQQQGINVFICGSLVGGTGSGTMLDLAHLIRAYFTDLGTQAEFCHITGVGVLPQAFHGISGPNLLPNTGAFLQELNHLMVKGGFQARYPDGRFVNSQETPFDIFYAIDGVDARGQTWADVRSVTAMTAEGIYLQMGTQLGKKGENAFDNLDEVLTGQSADGQGHFLGSFGKGDLVFNAPAVADLHTRWFLLELLQQSWLQPADSNAVPPQVERLTASFSSEQVRQDLLRDPETDSEMQVELTLPAWLRRKSADEVADDASQYINEYGLARIKELFLPAINQHAELLTQTAVAQWTTWLAEVLFSPEYSLATIIAILSQGRDKAERLEQLAQKQAAAEEQQLLRLVETVAQLETAVSRAASSFPLGRQGRIRNALKQYFQAAQTYYETQVAHGLARGQRTLWVELGQKLRAQLKQATALRDRLTTIAERLEKELPAQLSRLGEGGVAAISLAEPDYVQALYAAHKPGWADVQQRLGDVLALFDLDAKKLQREIVAALTAYYEPVARIGIEQVVAERTEDISPRGRRQQLFRLATPSWNLDRSRLADGGAGLALLEVLGVPDADNTLFEGEPMLVSTRDPHRLTALVVVAGAPPSALQQYDLYQQAIETNHSKRPLFILPDFLATGDQGRLMFALGSIFDFIYSQGTFFYYRPEDPLSNPVKLANGLNNSIQIFMEREGLVTEVNERVNARIASLGLREAIATLTEYYSNIPANTSLNQPLRELKRLVRDYADSLRGIDEFRAGIRNEK
ncbi:MAG: hypothetical protein GY803_12640 [Chloroflexi bacterium]|nr:hypothetical protein [Chloroflexota bacterium]